MKIFTYILVLVLLPFQFVWAAAAPLCAHEMEPNSKFHLGHHSSGSVSDPAKKALEESDQDRADGCGTCHFGASQIASSLTGVSIETPANLQFIPVPLLFDSHTPLGPDGPDWHSAA